jgi:hypothetical protein
MDLFEIIIIADMAAVAEEAPEERPRKIRELRNRDDPRELFCDREFVQHFRMSKNQLSELADLLNQFLAFDTQRGNPLPPIMQVCLALNHYAGGHFQRTSGYCARVSTNAARNALLRVTRGLCEISEEYIAMPEATEMADTARRMLQLHRLPNFAYGVDGLIVKFDGQPRGLPVHIQPQLCWSRKQCWAMNIQVQKFYDYLFYN